MKSLKVEEGVFEIPRRLLYRWVLNLADSGCSFPRQRVSELKNFANGHDPYLPALRR